MVHLQGDGGNVRSLALKPRAIRLRFSFKLSQER